MILRVTTIFLAISLFFNYGTVEYDAESLEVETVEDVFSDNNLALCVAESLEKAVTDSITREELDSIIKLECSSKEIVDLSGIERLSNVRRIDLKNNQIVDLKQLSELQNVRVLNLSSNKLVDISSLATMTSLESLFLNGNQIQDITIVENLHLLTRLNISANQISNLSPLINLSMEAYVTSQNQRITLAEKEVTGNSFSLNVGEYFKNVCGEVDGKIYDINRNGVYDETTNTITWDDLAPGTAQLAFTFDDDIEHFTQKDIGFSGKVKIPVTIKETEPKPDEKPSINVGNTFIELGVGEEVNLIAGIEAIDTEDGDLTSEIVVNGEVDVKTPGVYSVSYQVSDSFGNKAEASRVYLVNNGDYVIGDEYIIHARDFKISTTQVGSLLEEEYYKLSKLAVYDKTTGNLINDYERIGLKLDRSQLVEAEGEYEISFVISSTGLKRNVQVLVEDFSNVIEDETSEEVEDDIEPCFPTDQNSDVDKLPKTGSMNIVKYLVILAAILFLVRYKIRKSA